MDKEEISQMTTEQELILLLKKVQRLGLTFDIGTAYISRAYIDAQNKLNEQINSLIGSLPE